MVLIHLQVAIFISFSPPFWKGLPPILEANAFPGHFSKEHESGNLQLIGRILGGDENDHFFRNLYIRVHLFSHQIVQQLYMIYKFITCITFYLQIWNGWVCLQLRSICVRRCYNIARGKIVTNLFKCKKGDSIKVAFSYSIVCSHHASAISLFRFRLTYAQYCLFSTYSYMIIQY